MAYLSGGSSSTGPFEHYPVAESSIWSAGDVVARHGADIDNLRTDVVGAHRPAQHAVAGLLVGPMAAAPRPVEQRTAQWTQSAVFAGGAVRLFGDAVQAYNAGIDDLNTRYWSAKAGNFGVSRPTLAADATGAQRLAVDDRFTEDVAAAGSALLAMLRRERDTVLEPALDAAASQTAGLLDRGPGDDAAVLALYEAGALPLVAPLIFPGVDFTLAATPLGGADGRRVAEMVRRALAGDASPDEFREAMLLLQRVTDRVEAGRQLTEDEVAFLHEFYNGLGDRIWDVPDYIRADEHHWDAAAVNPFGWFDKDADGYRESTQRWMLGAMGTGILALSNNRLWDPAVRSSDPMDLDSRYHLPETVIDLVTDPAVSTRVISIGTSPYQEINANRMGDFTALARMLDRAPDNMQGGTRFSELLTQRVAEIASAAQRVDDYDLDQPGLMVLSDDLPNSAAVSRTLQTLIDVSTRNQEADYNLLTGRTDDLMARIGTHIEDRVYQLDNRQFLLSSLYHFDWSDDGKAVAGLTDWIAERADAAHQLHGEDPMASEAAAGLIDVVTTTERGEGHSDNHRVDMYDDLMRTLSDKNPEVARSFSRIAASYLDDFGEPSAERPTGVEGDGSLTLSDHDKIRFLDLVATDERAVNGLSYATGQYEQRLLAAGLNGDVPMTEVGQRSERLDGLLTAARVNATTVGNSQEFEDASAAYDAHMRYAGLGKTALTTAAGPAGPVATAGLDVLVDQVIDETLPQPVPDTGSYPGTINDQGRDDTHAAYEYLTALNATGRIPADQIPGWLVQHEPAYPGGPSMPVYDGQGHPVLRPVGDLPGGMRQDLVNLVGNEDTGIGGAEYEAYRDNYHAVDSYELAAADDPDRADAHRRGSDD